MIAEIVALIPDAWLAADAPRVDGEAVDATAHRAAYAEYLTLRLEAPRAFVAEALRARGGT